MHLPFHITWNVLHVNVRYSETSINLHTVFLVINLFPLGDSFMHLAADRFWKHCGRMKNCSLWAISLLPQWYCFHSCVRSWFILIILILHGGFTLEVHAAKFLQEAMGYVCKMIEFGSTQSRSPVIQMNFKGCVDSQGGFFFCFSQGLTVCLDILVMPWQKGFDRLMHYAKPVFTSLWVLKIHYV